MIVKIRFIICSFLFSCLSKVKKKYIYLTEVMSNLTEVITISSDSETEVFFFFLKKKEFYTKITITFIIHYLNFYNKNLTFYIIID